MTISVSDLLNALNDLQYDPTAVQDLAHNVLVDVSNGDLEMLDPTNPAAWCIEIAAVMTASLTTKDEARIRRLYPTAAQTWSDLYLHASDKHMIGRFATPATANFSILIAEDELLSSLVYDPATQSNKIVIPRNTFFTVADTVFSLQYPIVISQMQHKGLQIVYDVSKASPLQTLETNAVAWEPVSDGTTTWIKLTFQTTQFNVIEKFDTLSASRDFSLDVLITDAYYFTRVYVQNNDGTWNEIATTYTDQIYDVNSPTAVVTVEDTKVTVRVPQIYMTAGNLASKKIRIDVYQTKGALALAMSNYGLDQFAATWMNYDDNDNTVFTAPVSNLRQVLVYSTDTIQAGANGLSLDDWRSRIIRDSTGSDLDVPITTNQLEIKLEKLGYDVINDVDNITNRVLLAIKAMPAPTNAKLITPAAASVETVSIDLEQAALLKTVVNNGTSVTVTPDTLYRETDGVISLVTSSEVEMLLALPADKRAQTVTNNDYRFTPFHYVLDASGAEFDVRAYYLDAPLAVTKSFVAENDTTLLQVSTASYGIFRTANGYTVQIVTQSSDAFKTLPDEQVFVQLAFIPKGEKDRAYLNGTFQGLQNGERVFNFDVATNFNVTSEDILQLTKFALYTSDARLSGAELNTTFDILYSVTSPMDTSFVSSGIDKAIGKFLLPYNAVGVAQELLQVKFGAALSTLWTRGRTYVTGSPYKTYQVDVPMRYANDVYETVNGSAVQFDSNGHVVLNKLHSKDDPVLDADGETLYQFRAGDIILDGNGNPIPDGNRGLKRLVDLMLIEGAYWFATDAVSTGYRKELTETLVSWMTTDLATLSNKTLDKTRIYFHPKNNLGMIDVNIGNGQTKTIPALQSLILTLQVSETVNKNEALKKTIQNVSIATLSAAMNNPSISVSAITKELGDLYGSDVSNAQLAGLGGSLNLQALRVVDDASRCALKKRLVAQANGVLITEEDVTFNWVVVDL